MPVETVTRLFDRPEDASAAYRQLQAAGFPESEISIAMADPDGRLHKLNQKHSGEEVSEGATTGDLIMGGLGIAALGALAIPGIGPIIAGGALLAAGATAATGGMLGTLIGFGVSESDSHVYAEGVRQGGSLLTVRSERAAEAQAILDSNAPVDLAARERDYRATGWTRFDG
ncbi:hypothetical protein EOD42_00940 [Rhodovarius crocodyli]|uniref:DUF1269 domain-containing protein n=1 Tax=Rhodovarius crocodyli TaxID=1979269 RepID=A0A437MM59_9PROT|nr:hypothetical protein [Rhodovarius crocodyli]RVT98709.1 hypothetical protein EOD42_00940 [Rhodovarius crocodyli]